MFKAATVTFKESFSRNTGQRMGKALVEKLGITPKACWLFCSPENGLEELVKGVSETIGTSYLIGCTTDGEISDEGFSTGAAVLGGIYADQVDFEIVFTEKISRDSEQTGKELARQFSKKINYIQLFSDGLTGNGSAILRGIAHVIGEQIPISGGTAGDAGKFQRTWQFAGKKILSDAAVAIGFSGNFQLGIGIQSGWDPIGLAKKVTRASGNILYELNGEPALKVYERFLGRHAEKLPGVGVEYPLLLHSHPDPGDKNNAEHGNERYKGFNLLRATMSVNREDGSVIFAGDIPQGAMVCLTCGDSASVLEAAGKAARMALTELGETAPAMVFCYSCMARKLVLGRHAREELERIRREVGTNIPIIGFYSYGEYCRIKPGGPSFLHNETATISALGMRSHG